MPDDTEEMTQEVEALPRAASTARPLGVSDAPVDLRVSAEPWQVRRAAGKALRDVVPFAAHAAWQADASRPDPIDIIEAANAGRIERLIPLRIGRMSASPFAFMRGSAALMARDLAHTPSIGLSVMIDGDAHLQNFGLYRTPSQEVVFDLNDFDETTIGPWEWDIKRLTVSVNLAARENGADAKTRRAATRQAVAGYRSAMAKLQEMSVLEMWQMRSYADLTQIEPPEPLTREDQEIVAKAVERARRRTHATMLERVAEKVGQRWRFRNQPPVLTHLSGDTKSRIVDGLTEYAHTLTEDRQAVLRRYHVEDVCHRVVGVGSVGTRAYLALLLGDAHGDPLFLQIKEGIVPGAAPYVAALPHALSHQGRRVVCGQRLLQTSSDMLLGWTTIEGRDFYVRQMKQMRGSIPVDWLHGATLDFYAWSLGLLLARAHARTGDAAAIAGYCGSSGRFDDALADWAEAYAGQCIADHAALLAAIKAGRLTADTSA